MNLVSCKMWAVFRAGSVTREQDSISKKSLPPFINGFINDAMPEVTSKAYINQIMSVDQR